MSATSTERPILKSIAWVIGLIAAGAVLGWVLTRGQRNIREGAGGTLDGRFIYDVSAYESTDPALLRFKEVSGFALTLDAPTGLDIRDGVAGVCGKGAVVLHPIEGGTPTRIDVPGTPRTLALLSDGRVAVALRDRIAFFSPDGRADGTSALLNEGALITALAEGSEEIFVADAGAREVVRMDLQGQIIGRFGRMGAGDGTPGFVIPSPYFDLHVGRDGRLWVVNPGRHRLERYTPEGRFELAWGTPSMAIEGFCGCCNPVHFTRLADGRFITSEKGLTRVKVYSPHGDFEGVVAGPEQLTADLEAARKALTDPHAGRAYDVACDGEGRVYVLDPVQRRVRIFEPLMGDVL